MYSGEFVNRLVLAIDYLKHNGYPKQKDIAEKMGVNTSNLSQAIKGSDRYLTSSFMEKFFNTFKFFNEKWFVDGESDMLLEDYIEPFTFDDSIFDDHTKISDLFRLLIRNHDKLKENELYPLYRKFIVDDAETDDNNKESRDTLLG
jgi:transcriptional regulator with XRE-family HTH domain